MTQAAEAAASGTASAPDRNLALELVRVTEAAAMGAGRWVGRGDKNAADQAAVDAMRPMLDTVSMDGVVVIGEGEKDEAPMLYNGEQVGNGHGPEVDVAVDPLEGTRLTALGPAERDRGDRGRRARDDVLPRRRRLHGQDRRRPGGADVIDINASPTENVKRVAEAKGVTPREVSRRRARARPARGADRRAARGGREGAASSATATSRRRSPPRRAGPASTC